MKNITGDISITIESKVDISSEQFKEIESAISEMISELNAEFEDNIVVGFGLHTNNSDYFDFWNFRDYDNM